MSKLPAANRFLDLSDYGRPIAKVIANGLKNTSWTPIHVTTAFIVSGILAIVCILNGYYLSALLFLILKSILDAADGELARVKGTPSYIGRYYDSIADIILNFLFLLTIWYITDDSWILLITAFIGIQLQGTQYNYYYVILRNKVNGDTTSRIFEDHAPTAHKGENQKTVTNFYNGYNYLYLPFDKIIYHIDKQAIHSNPLPNWFMTMVSIFGLGFQLLTMGVMLVLGYESYILTVFSIMTLMIFAFVMIRKLVS